MNKIIYLSLLFGLFHQSTWAETSTRKLLNQLKSATNLTQICHHKRPNSAQMSPGSSPRPAGFFIRDNNGVACREPYVAAMAEFLCKKPNTDNFIQSSCHKTALKVLKNIPPINLVKNYLAMNRNNEKQIFCRSNIAELRALCASPSPLPPQPIKPPTPIKPPSPPVLPQPSLNEPPQYTIMGISSLHKKGLTGKGVVVGVIEVSEGKKLDPRIKDMNFTSQDIPDDHGVFVLGLIAGKQGTAFDQRIGIAPDAIINFINGDKYSPPDQENFRVTIEEPYYFDDGSLNFAIVVPAGGVFEFDNKGNDKKIYYLNPQTNKKMLVGSHLDFLSETNLVKDQYNNKQWHKMMTGAEVILQLKGKNSLVAGVKRATSIKELLDVIKQINDEDAKKSLKDLVLDPTFGLVFQARYLEKDIKGLTTVVIDPQVDELFAKMVNHMMKNGVSIINASRALPIGDKTKEAIKQFAKNGSIFVAAAGNENVVVSQNIGLRDPTTNLAFNTNLHKLLKEDAAFRDSFVLVGALTPSLDKFANFSTRAGAISPERYISAWGEDIVSYDANKGVMATSPGNGTSYAAPVITGILALLKEAFPQCSAKQLADALLNHADSLGANQLFISGKGRVNAIKTYDALMSSGNCR